MKIEGDIFYIFSAYYDDETGEVELKNNWFNEKFMWLFNVLNDLEGFICYLRGEEHYFKFKDKIK